ncbi:1,4-alpha-glucan branching protein GlgB [Ornithinimicrobium cryptoxanthini]|uniref:1,4-alpha-glucan branching enzyme GlgB n=1 Tax=Ornithinimicrobium cryptoxanthini TaxID=2934161 RepID=A0ABY4YFS3_9MICO|nr:1,4-alpha-glucan branching protein GlgB [Ornithinimicrobium cryptoxanthini]USQ75616.1 1,4-alpha-glucan branching protein GlgB [Ornithinimicrobium cryptoxanthini]
MATLTPSFADFLPGWVARQRWFAGKGREPQLRRIGGYRLEDPADEVGIDVHLVVDESGPRPVTYHVPLTYRGEAAPELHTALVATTEHDELGTRWVYDGCHDPVYVQALADLMHSAGSVSGSDEGTGLTGSATTARSQGPRPVVRRSAVLVGEQSNTSIIVETGEPGASAPVIIKVFRVLQAGENPDVAVQSALAEAGSTLVPQPVGWVSGTWHEADGSLAEGHLAFAQEFLPGVQDAWRLALVAARDDEDFTERARLLGSATAQVHATLRVAFGTQELTSQVRQGLLDRWRERHEEAVAAAPELQEYADRCAAVYAAAAQADWPPLQRVHGDYHLGQVLDVPDRGWVLVDFEGEPLRALEERARPDLALRDVAGMLRSFDYAAGSIAQEGDLDRGSWAGAARTAFLDGYATESGEDLSASAALLAALELDKVLYEVVYEARNRPSWVGIPVAAVRSLVGRPTNGASEGPASTLPAEGGGGDEATTPGPRVDLRQPADPPPAAGEADQQNHYKNAGPGDETTTKMGVEPRPLDDQDLERLLRGLHHDPHSILGAHPHDGGITIRALRPLAETVTVLVDGGRHPMRHEKHGIWTAVVPGTQIPDYRIEVSWGGGGTHVQDDPYRFLPTLGEMDRHLISEGRHEQLWKVLGAHLRTYDGPLGQVRGTSFAVWAPHARGVHVVGDFNQWDNTAHPMRVLGTSGIWEIFVPDVWEGTRYKFDISGPDGHRRLKADPMARASEVPPSSASVVTHSWHEWGDEEWLRARAEHDPHSGPMSIYEVHLGSWRQGASYRDLAEQLTRYVSQMGFTHVELMPVMQHPYAPSWGYHVTGYYAADARFGSPDDLRYLIDRLHQEGIGVILDWVPGHFATDPWALARFDGTPIYEHPDPRRGWQKEWGSFIFDFGRPEVRNFLVANALYWLEEFHADGLRVDGVASMLYLDYSRNDGEWLPNKFGGRENLEAVALLQETNATAYRRSPGVVIIAEESTSWPGVTRSTESGGLGFGFKWNMGWMHDSLDYIHQQPIHRQYHHHQMTFSLMYAFSEQFVLPISHDEVVHGKGSLLRKMGGNDRWQQLASLRAYLAFMWAHPGKQLLFMGQEFAQIAEWADGRSLDWWLLDQPAHVGVQHLVRDLNLAYRDTSALWQLDHKEAGFQWLNADDAGGNTFSFIRYGTEDDAGQRPVLVALANFSGQPRQQVRVGVPRPGRWKELVNTDADYYGGSGVGNLGAVEAVDEPHQGQPHSVVLTLPPLGMLWLVPEAVESAVVDSEVVDSEAVAPAVAKSAAVDSATSPDTAENHP